MKNCIRLLLVLFIVAVTENLPAQGTAFTYQSRLNDDAGAVNGFYDLTFSLFNASGGGAQVGLTLTNPAVVVTNGLFTVTEDFGPVFNGTPYWLQIGVRTNGSASGFSPLSPRQELTPTPYAAYAANASLSGAYSGAVNFSNKANIFAGNGGGLTNLNAANLTGSVSDAQLASDVALLDASQTFTARNVFEGTNEGIIIKDGGPIGTNLFSGLGFQYNNSTGEGAIISSFNDGFSSLSFYTKQGGGIPIARQVIIDRYGGVAIDEQDANNGVINDGSTNGVGLTFGSGSGEGIASQRTAGVNNDGLDFYTGHNRRLSILKNGDVGIGKTNPATALDVNGTVTATGFAGNASGLTNLNISQLTTPVVTNNEPAVTLGNLTLSGSLTVPLGSAIYTGNSSELYSDDYYNFFAGLEAGDLATIGTANTAIGGLAMHNARNDAGLVAVGYEALYNDNAGIVNGVGKIGISGQNTAVGYQALLANTNGTGNTAVGYQAMIGNTSGGANTASGGYALQANTSGINNTADGFQALNGNTTGSNNTAVGNFALFTSSAQKNTAIGVSALGNSQNDNDLVAVGYQALQNDNAGNNGVTSDGDGHNTAIGYNALQADLTGPGNTATGYESLGQNTNGSFNTADGNNALKLNATGSNNVAVGNSALQNSVNDSELVAIGNNALENDDATNAFTTSGNGENTGVGYQSLQANSRGYDNTAAGYKSLAANTRGTENAAFGAYALSANTVGSNNVATGPYTMSFGSGNDNTADGFEALSSAYESSENVAVGSQAMGSTLEDSELVAVGFQALENDTASGQGSPSGYGENTAIGYNSLLNDSLGFGNTAVGYRTLLNTTGSGGDKNTALGAYALDILGFDLITYNGGGTNNIAVGYEAGSRLAQGDNDICIGNIGTLGDAGIIRIGTQGLQSATYLTGTVYADGVKLTSDRNAKENFQPVDNQSVLAKVAALPVTQWNYKSDARDIQHIGPMAQDFQAAFGLDGGDDKHISVVDEGGVALAAIQGLNQKLADRDAEIQDLKLKVAKMASLENRLGELEKVMLTLAAKK